MPSFQPPLAQTTQVYTKPDHYLNVSFTVAFDDSEDPSGQWEIWTDLPVGGLNENDLVNPSSWRAVRFEDHDPRGQSCDEDSGLTSKVLMAVDLLSSTASSVSSRANRRELRARVMLPKNTSGVYAYTFRHVHVDSSIEWLGGEGSNGVIDIGRPSDSASLPGQLECIEDLAKYGNEEELFVWRLPLSKDIM